MRRRRRFASLVLSLTAAGCSAAVEDKPSTSRLQAGQVVIMAPRSGGVVVFKPPGGVPYPRGTPAAKLPTLLAGDTARVITDESEVIGFNRPVRCVVLQSSSKLPVESLAGTECLITRGEIRPVTKE